MLALPLVLKVHACWNFIGDASSTNRKLLKIGFENAFNVIRRDWVLQKVLQSFPQIYSFVYQAYATSSNLFFGIVILFSKEGVQLGDPLDPLPSHWRSMMQFLVVIK